MDFNTYLEKHRISTAQAAKELGKSRQHIWEIRQKKAYPGYKLMQQIDEWTKHVVSFVDFKR